MTKRNCPHDVMSFEGRNKGVRCDKCKRFWKRERYYRPMRSKLVAEPRCPRCGGPILWAQPVCTDCQLRFFSDPRKKK